MFSWEIYEFFRSSHRSYFKKKAVLKNFAILTGKLQSATSSKTDCNTGVFLWTPTSKSICSVSSCFCPDSFIKFRYVINRLRTIKLLTIQWKFINLCLLAKGWSMLHENLNQDLATNFFKQQIHSCEIKNLFTF